MDVDGADAKFRPARYDMAWKTAISHAFRAFMAFFFAELEAQVVASLVLLADDDPNWRPHAFHYGALGTGMRFSFATAKLLDYAERGDELLASDNPFAWITLAHVRIPQARGDPDTLYAAKWQLTRALLQQGRRKQRILALFKVINWRP